MKIILIQDVKKLGKKGDIIEANDGYARNYIIPQKLGVEANNRNINDLKLQKSNQEKLAQEQLEQAQALGEVIQSKKVVVKMKAGEKGRVFGSVSSKEIVEAAKQQCDLALDKKKVLLEEPLKSFGEHTVMIKLHPQVTASLKVEVEEA